MSVNVNELRGWILGIVIGIVLVVAGFILTNVLHVIGGYIVANVNQTITTSGGTASPPLVSQTQIQIVGLALMMAGITLVITAVAMMIKVVIESVSRVGAS